jgi:hypothetical protein
MTIFVVANKTMKLIPLLILMTISFSVLSQEKGFLIQGKIVTEGLKPIPDVHVINYRNLQKVVSSATGTFNILVETGDSLMVSHIAFYRRRIYADSVGTHPVIQLVLDTVNITDINVSPDEKSDYEKAMDNIASIKQVEVGKFEKIKRETTPQLRMMTEHNELMRSEAASISLLRFSPLSLIDKLLLKIRRRKKTKKYYSSKKKK